MNTLSRALYQTGLFDMWELLDDESIDTMLSIAQEFHDIEQAIANA